MTILKDIRDAVITFASILALVLFVVAILGK